MLDNYLTLVKQAVAEATKDKVTVKNMVNDPGVDTLFVLSPSALPFVDDIRRVVSANLGPLYVVEEGTAELPPAEGTRHAMLAAIPTEVRTVLIRRFAIPRPTRPAGRTMCFFAAVVAAASLMIILLYRVQAI